MIQTSSLFKTCTRKQTRRAEGSARHLRRAGARTRMGLLMMGATICLGCLAPDTVAHASSSIEVSQADFIFVPAPVKGVFSVLETMSLASTPKSPMDFEVDLPTGFQNLSVAGVTHPQTKFRDGQPYVLVPTGSQQSVTVSYELPLQGGQGVQFQMDSPYPIYKALLYLPVGQADLSAPNLQAATQTLTIHGLTFRVFTRLGIPKGDHWPMSIQYLPGVTANRAISGLPVIGSNQDQTGSTAGALSNLLLALLVLVIGLVGIRSAEWTRRREQRLTTQEALLRSLEWLDYQYETGSMEDETYRSRREELKRKLVGMELRKAAREN